MYKKGQGMSSRIGVTLLGVLLAFYAGNSYYWFNTNLKESLAENLLHHSFFVAIIIFVGMSAAAIFYSLYNTKSVDYLIDMDVELRKVVWPAVQPLFDPKTEAWGSTYIVIGCTVVLTLFIAAVDVVLQKGITEGLLNILYRS